jgi:hypothetical protein
MALLNFPDPLSFQTYTANGNTWEWNGTSWISANNLNLSDQVTGVLGTVYGGTGKALSGMSVGSVIYADTSSSFAALAPGTNNYVLATQGSGSAPYWKIDDSGTGSVGSGTTGGFAYYNGLNSITSGSGVSYISASSRIVLTSQILSLPSSVIDSGTWSGTAISLPYGGTNGNRSGIAVSYQLAVYDSGGTAITQINTTSSIGNSVLLQTAQNAFPTWVGQSTLTVGLAVSSTNAGLAVSSTNAGLAVSSTSAGLAVSSTNAGLAVSSTSAGLAISSTNAGLAVSSTSAGLAISSTNAGLAVSSTNAGFAASSTNTANTNIVGDTTSQIFFTGSRSSSSIGNTPVYVLSGVSALGNTITATTFSGNATTATNAGLAVSSTNAGLAVSSTNAGLAVSSTSAGLAVSSTSAGLAISSTNAGLAVSSTSAGLAISSTNAGLAVSSTNAGFAASSTNTANTNIVGDTTSQIFFTGSRSSSSIGNTPIYVLSGVSALGNTITATTFSGNATTATNAGLAVSSTNAGLAVSSTSAGLAISSTNAGLAVSSTSAGLAVSSTNAGLAVSSTSAGLAISSTNAGLAVSSTNAGLAVSASRSETIRTQGLSGTNFLALSSADSATANQLLYVGSGISVTATLLVVPEDTRLGNNTQSTNTSSGALIVSGGAGITGNLNVGGNFVLTGDLTVNGTTTTVNSTVSTVVDPIVTIGTAIGGTVPSSTDSKDRGIAFYYVSGTGKTGFFGWDQSASKFALFSDAVISGEVVTSGTKGVLVADLDGNAGTATSSVTAGLAVSSTNAGLAVSSTNAGLAVSSTNAGLAVSSTSAGLAISSTNAGLAVSSTNAGFAASSTNTANTNIVGDTTSTIYFTGSRSNSSIGNTPIYVLSGVSALGNTITATTFSGNATTATNAGLAVSSTNAGLAVSSTSAGLAISSTNAGLAVSSTNAGLAVSSTSAGLAISSTNAGLAVSSTNAGFAASSTNTANTNIVGDTTSTIYFTGSRSSSSIGNTPVYVLSGVSALGNTITATTFSGNATTATNAGLAVSSTNAGLAVSSTSAGLAISSTNAGLAVSSTSAGLAISSTNAGLAVSSTNAGLAVSSTSAGLAISSTNAGLAVSSTNSGLSQKTNVSTFTGAGTSFLAISDVVSGTATIGATSFITINASAGSIGATTVTANHKGTWTGTAVTALYGGTGLDTVSKLNVLTGSATGNTWTAIGSSTLPVAYISENAPAALTAFGATQPGQLWWDSTYGVLKVYYSDINTNQWVDALPVLGSNGGSAVKRSYLLSFGAGFTPSLGSDSVSILIPFAPDNSVSYYYIKRLELRNEGTISGAGASFFIERNTTRTPTSSWTTANTIFSAAGSSFKAGAGIYITSYTNSGSGASFVSSAGVAASIMSGDYLRLNFTALNGAATLAVSLMIEEQ